MQHDHSLSLATTASGMVGGVGRAIAEQHSLSSISLHGVIDVAFYAVVSCALLTMQDAQRIKQAVALLSWDSR